MKKHINSVLLSLLLVLGICYLGVIAVKDNNVRREIHFLREQGLMKDSVSSRVTAQLQAQLTKVTYRLDSLEERYAADSTSWYQERAELKGTLWKEKKEANTYKTAYESTKKALERQKIPSPARIYDLSPVLDDSTTP